MLLRKEWQLQNLKGCRALRLGHSVCTTAQLQTPRGLGAPPRLTRWAGMWHSKERTGHLHIPWSLWLWYILHQRPGKEHKQRSGSIPWPLARSRRWMALSSAGTVAHTTFPKTPPQANRPAAVTPSLTRSKAEACKRSPTTSVTHHPQGNRHNPLESYLEASSPSSPKLWGTSRGAGALRRSCSSPRLAKGGLSRALLLLGPPDTSLGCRRCSAASPQRQGWSASPRDGPVPPRHPLVPHPVPVQPRGAPRAPQLVSSGAQPSLGTPLRCPISLSPRRRTAELAPDTRPKGCGISETRGDDYEMPRGRTKWHQGRPALPVLLLPGSVWAGFLVLLRRDGVRLSRAM